MIYLNHILQILFFEFHSIGWYHIQDEFFAILINNKYSKEPFEFNQSPSLIAFLPLQIERTSL